MFRVLGVGPDGVEYLARKRAIRTIPLFVDEATDWLKELEFDKADTWDNDDSLPHNGVKHVRLNQLHYFSLSSVFLTVLLDVHVIKDCQVYEVVQLLCQRQPKQSQLDIRFQQGSLRKI